MSKTALPRLGNREARRLFLDRHALAEPPTGPSRGADLLELIERLGFVQVDSINTVERAHHMILFARRHSYRPKHLKPLLERDRTLFEHWTHDASIVPCRYFPFWRLRFERSAERLRERWRQWRGDDFLNKFDEVLERIRAQGAVTTSDIGESETRSSGGWWEWHPSKTAVEYLWRTGAVSVCHRQGFFKAYDLTERVIPQVYRDPQPTTGETIDWACGAALDRLGFATSGEIAAFWDAVTPQEAKSWCDRALRRGDLVEVEVECANGTRPRRCFGRPDIREAAAASPEPTARIRILSPFDPMLRDRQRTERLFGFHYRIEVFVPAAKRRYGYYVFPVLEADRLVGRVDMKREDGLLQVSAFWPEAGVALGRTRRARLEAALDRTARFAQCEGVRFKDGWERPAG